MADFNISVGGPSEAGARPVAAIEPPRAMNTNAPLVNLAVGMTDIFMRNKVEADKQKKLELQNATISNYTQDMTKIAQGVETGELTDSKAAMLQQKTHRQYAAAFPVLTEEFGKINKDLTTNTALASVKSTQDMYESVKKTQATDMAKAGYPIYEGMPKEQFEANLKAYQSTTYAEGEFKRMAERASFKNSMDAAQRATFEFEQKNQANMLLAQMGDSHLNSTMLNVKSLIDETARTGNMQEGTFKLNQMFQGIEQTIASLSSANPTAANAYKEMFANLKKIGEEGIQGGKLTEASSNRLKLLENQVKFSALSSSPEAKTLYSSSYLFHGNMPSTFLNMNTDGKQAYAAIGSVFGAGKVVPQVVGTDALQGNLDALKSQIAAVNNGKVENKEATLLQAGNAANNILKQVGNAGGLGIDAKALNPAVEFLASPEFLSLHQAGKIDPAALQGAKSALQVLHEKNVVKAVEKELGVKGGAFDFTFNGAGVVLQPVGGKKLNYLEQGQQANVLAESAPIGKAITQLVYAGAHMQGRKDYGQYWEENKHFLVPSYYPDPAKLKVGQTVDGYKYTGGNVKDPANWEAIK